jgi:uncharacterized protein YacL
MNNNIVNSIVEATVPLEQDLRDRKWSKVITDLIGLVVRFVISAFVGQTLWNSSVPKLFPMLGKAGLYDVLYLHVFLQMILN